MRWAVLAAISALAGCDVVSGIDDFHLRGGSTATAASGGAAGGGAKGGGGASEGGAGGEGGDGGAPPPAPAACLPSDDFSGTLAQWTPELASFAAFTIANGELQLFVDNQPGQGGRYTRLDLNGAYNASACTTVIHLLGSTVGDEAGEEFYIAALQDAEHRIGFYAEPGKLWGGKRENGMDDAAYMRWSSTTSTWMRFYPVDAQVRFEVSEDGARWSLLHQTTVAFGLEAVGLVISGGAGTASGASGGTLRLDDFNLPP
jgi:hypothetical protein